MKSLSLSRPHMLVMVGIPGSGKSFFAAQFAKTFGAPAVSQETIAKIARLDEATSRRVAYYQLDELLKTRQSVIVDGIGDTRAERMELGKRARAAGYETLFIWVQTDPATAQQRATKETKGKDTPPLTPDEYTRRAKRFTPPNAIEKPVVISGKHTYATQAKVVLKKLSAPRADTVHTTEAPARPAPAARQRRNILIR